MIIIFIIMLLKLTIAQVINNFNVNYNFQLNKCNNSIVVVNNIRHAIQSADRDVFLSLNHDWLDNILINNKIINVNCMNIDELKKKSIKRLDIVLPNINDINEDDESIEIMYISMNNIKLETTSFTSGPIDNFLTYNPCWIVLQEPIPLNDNDNSNSNSNGDKRVRKVLKTLPIIFVKLPAYPYGPTCRLYTHLINRQFPNTCPDKVSLSLLSSLSIFLSLLLLSSLSLSL